MTVSTVKSSSSKHISQETKTFTQSPTSPMRSINFTEHFESAGYIANSRTNNPSSSIADGEIVDTNSRSSVKETFKKFIRWRYDPDDCNSDSIIHDFPVAVSTASAAVGDPAHTVSPTLSKSWRDSAVFTAADLPAKKAVTSCRPHYSNEENKAMPDSDKKENKFSGHPSSKSKFIVGVRRLFYWGHGKKENELDTTDKVAIKNPMNDFFNIEPSESELGNPQVNPIRRKRDTMKLVCSNSLKHQFFLPSEVNEQNSSELDIKYFQKHRSRSFDFPESQSPEFIRMQKNAQKASRGIKRKLAAGGPSQCYARFSAKNCDSRDGRENVANTLCLKDSTNPTTPKFFSLNSAPREVPKVAAQLTLSSDERKVNELTMSAVKTNVDCWHDSPRLLSSNYQDERISISRHNNENSIISSINVSDFYPLKDPENSPYCKSVDDHEFLTEGTKPIGNLDAEHKVDTMIAPCKDYVKKSFRRTSSSDFVYDVDVHQNIEALIYAGESDKSPSEDSQTIDWHGNEVVSQKRNDTHTTAAKGNGSAIYFSGIRDTSNDARDINLIIEYRNAGNEMLHLPRHSSYDTVVHYDIPTAATTLPDDNEDFEISNLTLEKAEQKLPLSNCGIDAAFFKNFGSLFSNAKKACTGCDGEDNFKTSAAKVNTEAILTTLLDASVPYSSDRDSNRGEFAKESASQKFGTAILNNCAANISTNGNDGNNPKIAEYEINSHDEQFKNRLPTGTEKPNSPPIRNSVPSQASPVKASRIGAYRVDSQVKSVTNTRWYGISPETGSNADVEELMVPYANSRTLHGLSSFNNYWRMKDCHDSPLKTSCNTAISHESNYPPSTYEGFIHHILGVKSNEVQQLAVDHGATGNNVTEADREPDHSTCREDITEYGIIETGNNIVKGNKNSQSKYEPGQEYGPEGNEAPSFYLTSHFEARTISSLAENSLRDHDGSNEEPHEAAILGASHKGDDADTDRTNSSEGAAVDTPSPTPPPQQADRAETQETLLPLERHQCIFGSVSPDSICFVHWPIVKENVVARVLGDYCPLRFRNNIRFDYDGSDFRVKQYYMTNRAILQEQYRTRRRVLFAPRPDKWFHFEEETEILDCLDDFIKVNKCLYPMFKGPRIVQRKHMFRRWKNRGRDRLIILEQLLQYWRQDPAYIEQLKREKELRRSSPLAYPQKPERPPIKIVLQKIIDRMTQDMAHKRLGRPPRAGSSVILLKKGPPLGIDYFGYKKQRAQEWVNNLLLKF